MLVYIIFLSVEKNTVFVES